MRKYDIPKYVLTSRGERWYRSSKVLYFLLGWNAIGIILYKSYSKKQGPEWEKMSYEQKYLQMTNHPDQNIRFIKSDVKFGVTEDKILSVEELCTSGNEDYLPAPPEMPSATSKKE